MGFLDWMQKKSADKGAANIAKDVEALAAVADASWAKTQACMEGGHDIPSPPPIVQERQKALLTSLTLWKGPLTDRQVLTVVRDTMQRCGAGFGASIAVRAVVLKFWPKSGDSSLTLTPSQMEEYVGPWSEVEEASDRVAKYTVARSLGRG